MITFEDSFANWRKLRKKTEDFYTLKKLSPGFQVIFPDRTSFPISNQSEELEASFEEIEKGSGLKLRKFLQNAEYKYLLYQN